MAKKVVRVKNQPLKTAETGKTYKKKRQTYRSFRLSKKIRHAKQLPAARKIFAETFKDMFRRWKIYGGIVLVYGLLYLIFVQSSGLSVDIPLLKSTIKETVGGDPNSLGNGLSMLTALVATGTTAPDQTSSIYQTILFIVVSLAVVWMLRQLYGRNDKGLKLRVRDAFYQGMTPLVPVILVFLLGLVQLLPALLGVNVYGVVSDSNFVSTGAERFLWLVLVALLSLLSLYMVVSTVIALYVVALPGNTPMQSLRIAKNLVDNRRFVVMRRFIVLPIFLLLTSSAILLPAIMFADRIVGVLFFIMNMTGLVLTHGYLYRLYRALLK